MIDTIYEWYDQGVARINSPTIASLVLLVGVACLVLGGRWLVNGSVALAKRLGISTLIVGLTVVAFGTSSPELAFNLIAAINNNTGLSFGNVIGSNIANIGLVLALSAITAPLVIQRRVLTKELPWLMLISLATIVLALTPPHIEVSRNLEFGFARLDGIIYLGSFVLFLIMWFRMARSDARGTLLPAEKEVLGEDPPGSLIVAGLLVVLGLSLLMAGGKAAEVGAVKLAEMFNVSEAVIGLTIVAIATSLPEAIASITACRAGHTDLAVGNVIGSNIFNLVLVLGITSTVKPLAIPSENGWFDLILMNVLTLVVLLLAWVRGLKIRRNDGLFLLLTYVAFLLYRTLSA